MRKTPEERFLRSFIRGSDNDCWIWTGPVRDSKLPYARLYLGQQSPMWIAASRYSYEHFIGPIPKGLFACHKCDNPRCVNPNHIFLGTHLDNLADMKAKGRSTKGVPRPYNRGTGNGNCRLTSDEVEAIRVLRGEGFTCQRIADQFGCAPNTALRIGRGLTHSIAQ